MLYFLHKSKDNRSYIINKYNYTTTIIILLISIISVRYNIINSVHNFINSESQDQYNYYLYITVIVSIIYVLIKPSSIKFFNLPTGLRFYFIFLISLFLFIYLYIVITSFFKIGFIFKDFYKNINIILILTISCLLFFNITYSNTSNTVFISRYYSVLMFNLLLLMFLNFNLLKQTLICILLVYLFVLIFIIPTKHILYNNNSSNIIIHVCIFLYVYKCMLQKYLFYPEYTSIYILNLNMNLFKCNNTYLFNGSALDYSNISLFIEVVDSIENFYKTIFEKKLFYNLSIGLIELFNYNYQVLIQPILGYIHTAFIHNVNHFKKNFF